MSHDKSNSLNTPTYTPTPWKILKDEAHNVWNVGPYTEKIGYAAIAYREADAAFIVDCVNSHAALKKANAELLKLLKGACLVIKTMSDEPDTVFVREMTQAIARSEEAQ